MKGDLIPDADHILRLVGGSHVDTDENGNPVITGGGFIARPRDDNKPSYNWLETFEGTVAEQVQQVRNVSRMAPGATAKLARLNVGEVRRHIEANTDESRVVTVIHDPLDEENGKAADPSHALMTNIPTEDDPQGEQIGDLIAQCVIESFPARA